MKKTLLSLFFLLFIQQIFAQVVEHYVSGELIIQLRTNALNDEENITSFCQSFQNIDLSVKKVLSKRMQIWLVTYQNNNHPDHEVLDMLKTSPQLLYAQFNHFVTVRDTLPDDPFFQDQWALMNYGQLGGVPDADIDATQAWSINTGGMTVLGDTIVLGIVDLGFDLEHEDLNFWKNYKEVPGNGIDEDENGYIDDYDGWNSISSNGQLPEHNHGTHVTGIAGAIGNNATGVSGVNWNVQIMPVASPTSLESGVVEAYGYILEMRARYNETNGEEGAFVVATNASFGVDQGDPDDYPLWGAMYDSLGVQGILSVGATANANWNIDIVGDVPTAFPSNYLITVTNTTNEDVKLSQAGYGPTTIDIGAPGYVIRSTVLNNQYDYKTGTSMSAPHITGAIGLLFAAADPATILTYRENPPLVARAFKDHILYSVDRLPGLYGITVTGGRLNIFKMLLSLLGEPILQQDPVAIDVAVAPDTQSSTELWITNTGGSTAHYTVFTYPQVDWFVPEHALDSVPADSTHKVVLNIATAGLAYGDHYTDLYMSYENDLQLHIPVHLLVTPFIPVDENAGLHDDHVMIYPNPSAGTTFIALTMVKLTRVQIDLQDLAGRCIWSVPDNTLGAGTHRFEWKSSSPGLYFCIVRMDQGITTRKVIIF